MLQTKQLQIYEQLSMAKEQLNEQQPTQQVSVVEPIDPINPVDYFTAFEHEQTHRMFWKDTTDTTYYVGIGVHKVFQANQDRFATIKNQWKRFLNDIMISDDVKKETGPLLFGGFSFNENIKGEKWANFKPGQMVLPKMMLTVNHDSYYMTYNVQLSQETDLDLLVSELEGWHDKVQETKEYDANTHSLQSLNSLDYGEWEKLINEAVETIKRGDLGKVVLARELNAKFNQDINISVVLKRLELQQSDSYIFIFDQGDETFISATPERLVRVQGRDLLSTCLAGTTGRGQIESEDDLLAWQLLNDEKNLNEHDYVVRMIKDAIEPLSETVDIPEKPVIYPLRALQHLYTPVTATLKSTTSIFDLIERLHPTPALGGEPRDKAIKYIEEEEPFERGWYAAPIGWIDHEGNGEFAVAIRSGLIQHDQATLFAGCGIVADSVPDAEFEETKLKFTPMLDALGGVTR
ncbi:isochorismate synthase [Tenuibacillus multivorans]|uniref:Isochorismate synthase MenF n=1 Tax=Tenuibacillus multivorans TaxID=237069 RepID=A0A1H0FRM3_9BACI|nr:isochorismate synthase [Tenuibacillus multivorans]GEL77918.1 isochorismate synthase MenF [Tenuibacillus multivorans]SDN97129.1 menaquinone-specific isochorismate synthase [Tenuibacillus multivorans]